MAVHRNMTINMGPQHPATHGVLRFVLELDGETVVKSVPHIGYLHRGIEKLMESKTYWQAMPLTDRLDYTSGMSNNLAYCLTVEKLLGIEIPKRAQYIRVALSEFQRIAAHLLWLATHALDIGAMTLFFYGFRERENVLKVLEMVSGARLMPAYIRFGGLREDLPSEFASAAMTFLEDLPRRIDEYETLLTENVIWKGRTRHIGYLSAEDAISYGVTGPVLRASGVNYDVRKAYPYTSYEDFDFEIPLGTNCDVYDRYLVRLQEMRQSIRIATQAINRLPAGPINALAPEYVTPEKGMVQKDMAALIRHFKLMDEGIRPPKGEAYSSIESSKGELGFYIVSDGTSKPYRVRIRPPSFLNVSAIPKMIEGQLVADVVSAIGSTDVVLGEIDK
jgi:NADH-quinone oxidoreductase subunit D